MLKKRRAIGLPLVLIVLLVGGALVAAAFYVTENYYSSSKYFVGNARLYNAAVSGVEKGKGWVAYNLKRGVMPRWVDLDGDGLLSSADKPENAKNVYDALVAKVGTGPSDEGVFEVVTEDGVSLHIVVYDLAYEPASSLTYEKGFPPRLRPQVEGASSVVKPSYAVSGRGSGSAGEGAPGSDIGIYLIRCTATYKDKTCIVEQSVAMRL